MAEAFALLLALEDKANGFEFGVDGKITFIDFVLGVAYGYIGVSKERLECGF